MQRMNDLMEASLELILSETGALLVWEWNLLNQAVDYYDALIEQCSPDWDGDVLDHITAQLKRIEARCEISIRKKQVSYLRLVG